MAARASNDACQVHDLNDLASLDSGYGTAAPKQRAGRQGSRRRSRGLFNYVMGTWRSRWGLRRWVRAPTASW